MQPHHKSSALVRNHNQLLPPGPAQFCDLEAKRNWEVTIKVAKSKSNFNPDFAKRPRIATADDTAGSRDPGGIPYTVPLNHIQRQNSPMAPMTEVQLKANTIENTLVDDWAFAGLRSSSDSMPMVSPPFTLHTWWLVCTFHTADRVGDPRIRPRSGMRTSARIGHVKGRAIFRTGPRRPSGLDGSPPIRIGEGIRNLTSKCSAREVLAEYRNCTPGLTGQGRVSWCS